MLLSAQTLGVYAFQGTKNLFLLVLWGVLCLASNLTANKLIKVSPLLYLAHSFRAFFAGILMASIIQEYRFLAFFPLLFLNSLGLFLAHKKYIYRLMGKEQSSLVETIKQIIKDRGNF